MALDFPATPTLGQKYPAPSVAGVPTYTWDGEKWTTKADAIAGDSYVKKIGDTMSGPLVLPADPTAALHSATKQYADARGVDAMAYNNIAINGGFEVSQERGSTAFTLTQGANTYICDGWLGIYATAGALTITANGALPLGSLPGFATCLLMQTGTPQASLIGGDIAGFRQYIEGTRISKLGWGTANARPITIGFWARSSSIAGTLSVAVRNGATDRVYVSDVAIAGADTWQYKTITVPGDTAGTWVKDHTRGMEIFFCMASGTTYRAPSVNTWLGGNYLASPTTSNFFSAANNFYVTGVTLLPGAHTITAAQSPLLMRPYGSELEICRRYLQQFNTSTFYTTPRMTNDTYRVAPIMFSPMMRAAPTVAAYGKIDGGSLAALTLEPSSIFGSSIAHSVGNASSVLVVYGWFADARL